MKKVLSIFLQYNTILYVDWDALLVHPFFNANHSQSDGICLKNISDESFIKKRLKARTGAIRKKYAINNKEMWPCFFD